MKILVLGHDEIVELLPVSECIGVMREVLLALSNGNAFQPLRTIIVPPAAGGKMGLMPAYLNTEVPSYGLKALCLFPGNPAIGKDAHQGGVLLFSTETGELQSLMNASAITAIRTAAVSGVATDLLARQDASDLALVGAGVQAGTHLDAIASVRPLKRCRVASRTIEGAQNFVSKVKSRYGFAIEAVESVEHAVRDADIIATLTSSSQPILERRWIADGAHVNVVGSSQPAAREVDSQTMVDSTVFVDRMESTLNEAGDYLFPAREGVIGPDHLRAELGEILAGRKAGRTDAKEITLFKSLGLAIEDVAAAALLFRRASEQNAGTWVEFG